MNVRNFAFILLISIPVFLLAACGKEKKGNIDHPELTQVSTPRAGELPHFKGKIMDPYWPKTKGDFASYPKDLRGLRAFELTSHKGRPYTSPDIKGKYSLVTFFYAKCRGICPAITANVKRLSGQIKEQGDLRFVSITVDPENDDVKALRAYRARHKITQPNWTFLTGDRPQIEILAREQFAGEVKTREGKGTLIDFVHTENVFLLDKQGYLRGIYRARGTGDLERLKKDLKVIRGATRAKKS